LAATGEGSRLRGEGKKGKKIGKRRGHSSLLLTGPARRSTSQGKKKSKRLKTRGAGAKEGPLAKKRGNEKHVERVIVVGGGGGAT